MSTVRKVRRGERIGVFVVENPGSESTFNERQLSVRCSVCGALSIRSGASLQRRRYRESKACIRCRASVHAREVPCSDCGVAVLRWVVARGVPRCGPCAKSKKLRSRVMVRGRACLTCDRIDSDTIFKTTLECVSCNRAASRNGRCSRGHALRAFRACPCGRRRDS